MARRKIDERNIRSLAKVSGGTSYGITLPMEYIRKSSIKTVQLKEKIATFRVRMSAMGCPKIAYRAESKPVLRCVWNAQKQGKQGVNCYDYGARFYDLDVIQ